MNTLIPIMMMLDMCEPARMPGAMVFQFGRGNVYEVAGYCQTNSHGHHLILTDPNDFDVMAGAIKPLPPHGSMRITSLSWRVMALHSHFSESADILIGSPIWSHDVETQGDQLRSATFLLNPKGKLAFRVPHKDWLTQQHITKAAENGIGRLTIHNPDHDLFILTGERL